jgi:hypothetical protein
MNLSHTIEAAAHPAFLERLKARQLAVQDGADRELGGAPR